MLLKCLIGNKRDGVLSRPCVMSLNRQGFYVLVNEVRNLRYVYPVLLHAVAFSYRNGIVLQSLRIYGYTVRCAYRILSSVSFSYRIFLVILHKVFLPQRVGDLLCLFRHAVFLYQRQYGCF